MKTNNIVFKFFSLFVIPALVLFIFPQYTYSATIETFTTTGTTQWVVPARVTSVDYLVVGGGGGGGNSIGGGGGAGGFRTGTLSGTPGTSLTITIGAGGAGGATSYAAGSNGGDSVFSSVTSTGGGGGGGFSNNCL